MPLETHLQGLARAGAQYQKDMAAAREAERERAEKERIEAEANSPEAIQARFIAKTQAAHIEAIARQQAVERANFDAVARQKQEEEAKVRLLGEAVGQILVEQLKPTLDALTSAVNALAAQLKDGKPEV